jgi:predicted ATP-dependent endonuclease of OLD family
MKIIQLKISNIKKIKDIEIRPEESLIEITGRNGQGKTSVLDSITMALYGGKSIPSKPIRHGETSAKIEIDLGEFKITRLWTSDDKTYLTVLSKDGLKYSSPQAMLDKLAGSLSFDPLEFSRMESKKQKEILQQLIGLDFSKLNMKRAGLFEERRRLNVDIRDMEGKIKSMPYDENVGNEELNISDILNEQNYALGIAKIKEDKEREIEKCNISISNLNKENNSILLQIETLQNKLNENQEKIKDEIINLARTQEEINAINIPDINAINFKIKNANEINQTIKNNKAKEELKKSHKTKLIESNELTKSISAIDEEKILLLKEAKFPIDGLSFDDEGVSFNGIPFAQCSAAEQLKIAVAIGIALNPKIKVVLIRDGSLLDNDNLKVIAEMAKLNDAQIWIEKVADSKEFGIYIEDGEVKN